MNEVIVVALISLAGTTLGTFGGILTANKLTNYRLEMLESKVDKHNCVVERTYILEEKMKVANHRIEDLEDVQKNMQGVG